MYDSYTGKKSRQQKVPVRETRLDLKEKDFKVTIVNMFKELKETISGKSRKV